MKDSMAFDHRKIGSKLSQMELQFVEERVPVEEKVAVEALPSTRTVALKVFSVNFPKYS